MIGPFYLQWRRIDFVRWAFYRGKRSNLRAFLDNLKPNFDELTVARSFCLISKCLLKEFPLKAQKYRLIYEKIAYFFRLLTENFSDIY